MTYLRTYTTNTHATDSHVQVNMHGIARNMHVTCTSFRYFHIHISLITAYVHNIFGAHHVQKLKFWLSRKLLCIGGSSIAAQGARAHPFW
jgi:hypothetical protein